MNYSQWEKYEIIRLVEGSSLSVRRTLEQIGVSRSSFYEWYRRYTEGGVEGLKDRSRCPERVWNRIPDSEREALVEYTCHPEARFHLGGGKTIRAATLEEKGKAGRLQVVAPAERRVRIRVVEKGTGKARETANRQTWTSSTVLRFLPRSTWLC